MESSCVFDYPVIRQLTSVPHLAGTDQDFQQADWVRQKFVEYGMDQVDVVPYSVLLSYPNMKEPNKVYLLDANRRVRFFTSGRQKPLFSPEESSSLITPDFNAYSGTGIAEVDCLIHLNFLSSILANSEFLREVLSTSTMEENRNINIWPSRGSTSPATSFSLDTVAPLGETL